MIPTSFQPLGSGLSTSMDYVSSGLRAGHDGYFNGPGKLHSTDTLIWYDWTGNGNHTLDLVSEGFTGPLDWRLSGLMLQYDYFLRQTVVFPNVWNQLVVSQNYTLEVRSRQLNAYRGWKLSNYWAQGKTPFEWSVGRHLGRLGAITVVIDASLTYYLSDSVIETDPEYSQWENNTFAWSVNNGVYTCYVNGISVGQLNGGAPINTTNIGPGSPDFPFSRFTLGSRTMAGATLDDPNTQTLYDTNAFFQAIRLYDRPLTQEELAFNAATDFRRFGANG